MTRHKQVSSAVWQLPRQRVERMTQPPPGANTAVVHHAGKPRRHGEGQSWTCSGSMPSLQSMAHQICRRPLQLFSWGERQQLDQYHQLQRKPQGWRFHARPPWRAVRIASVFHVHDAGSKGWWKRIDLREQRGWKPEYRERLSQTDLPKHHSPQHQVEPGLLWRQSCSGAAHQRVVVSVAR